MRKIVASIIVIMAFIVSIFSMNTVSAKENVFSLTKAELKDKTESAEVINFSYTKNSINSDVTFHKTGDYITYKLTVKNVSDKDLTISSVENNNKNENIIYEHNNYKNVKVKKGESINILVKAKYKKGEADISKRDKNFSTTLIINYIDENGKSGASSLIVNPSTGDNILIFVGILVISLITILVILMGKKIVSKKTASYIMILSLILPIGVSAANVSFNITFTSSYSLRDKVVVTVDVDGEIEKKAVDYNTKLTIEDPVKEGYTFIGWKTSDGKAFDIAKPIKEDTTLKAEFEERVAILDIGEKVNVKMKYLANGTFDYMYYEWDQQVEHVKRSNTLPDDYEIDEYVTISSSDSEVPVYIWWDENAKTMYWYSKAKKIYLNPDSSNLFYSFDNLEDVSILEEVDTSNVENFSYALSDTGLTSLDTIESLDISNVTDMSYLFAYDYSLENFDPISNWDMSKVTTIEGMFKNTSLVTTDFLYSWNIESVTNMSHLFEYCDQLKSISGLTGEGWKTSNVTTIAGIFANDWQLEDYEIAGDFDTSNMTDISEAFTSCLKIDSLEFVSGWDTSKVENMYDTFGGLSEITTLHGLENWNTSNVKNMGTLVASCTKLSDMSAISDWDTSNVTDMSNMFAECSKLENLDDIGGWNISKVTTLYHTFANCPELKDISAINNWDTSEVTNINYLFYYSPKIEGTITLRGNITNYNKAFEKAATNSAGSVTVNYTSNIGLTLINNIIATKSYASKVYRGSLVS